MTLVAGIQHIRDGVEEQAIAGADMSVIGIAGTAPDNSTYELNQPYYINTGDPILVARLGEGGTIPKAIAAISANLTGTVNSAKVVFIIVEDDADPFTVIDRLVGNEALRTGMWGWLDSGKDLGVIPRLICVPGYMNQTVDGVSTIAITNGGADYTTASVAISGGAGTGATAEAVIESGVITGITITNGGNGFTSDPTVTITGDGSGATASATFSQLGNRVCAALPTILGRLNAITIPEGPATGREAAINWLETLPASMRMFHPVFQDALNGDAAAPEAEPLTPYLLGRYVSRDAEFDGVPSHGIANQSLYGLIGVTPAIDFSFTDENSECQDYLARSFGVVGRGESGVEDAISSSGFVFWGTDTLETDISWQFAHIVRLRDYIELGQVSTLKRFLGRNNITSQTIQAILNSLNTQILDLKNDGHILDGKVEFSPDSNLPSELRLGNIDIIFKAEEPPVLRKITMRSRKLPEALSDLAVQVSNQLNNF